MWCELWPTREGVGSHHPAPASGCHMGIRSVIRSPNFKCKEMSVLHLKSLNFDSTKTLPILATDTQTLLARNGRACSLASQGPPVCDSALLRVAPHPAPRPHPPPILLMVVQGQHSGSSRPAPAHADPPSPRPCAGTPVGSPSSTASLDSHLTSPGVGRAARALLGPPGPSSGGRNAVHLSSSQDRKSVV